MPSSGETLKERLARYRQIKISVIGRKSGKTISIPVWFVLEGQKLYLLLCLAKTSYTRKIRDLAKSSILAVPIRFMIVSFRYVLGWGFQGFWFAGRSRPRKPGSPSATAGSARQATSPSIDCDPQGVLGRVENVVVGVDETSRLGHS
jgi:hypothetical protein